MTNNQQPSEATQQEVFGVHLRYEIVRLIEQYALLLNPNEYCSGLKPVVAKTVHDGLLVAFCTHARNLLEFFFRKPDQKNYYYAVATDYGKSGYVNLDPANPDVDRLYKQLCAQINHLTYHRTDDSKKKIDTPEWKELIDIILSEAARLAPQLKSGYDKQHLRIDDLLNAAAAKKTETKRPKPTAQRTEDKGLKPIADRSFLLTEAAGTTSVAPSNVGAIFLELLKPAS